MSCPEAHATGPLLVDNQPPGEGVTSFLHWEVANDWREAPGAAVTKRHRLGSLK